MFLGLMALSPLQMDLLPLDSPIPVVHHQPDSPGPLARSQTFRISLTTSTLVTVAAMTQPHPSLLFPPVLPPPISPLRVDPFPPGSRSPAAHRQLIFQSPPVRPRMFRFPTINPTEPTPTPTPLAATTQSTLIPLFPPVLPPPISPLPTDRSLPGSRSLAARLPPVRSQMVQLPLMDLSRRSHPSFPLNLVPDSSASAVRLQFPTPLFFPLSQVVHVGQSPLARSTLAVPSSLRMDLPPPDFPVAQFPPISPNPMVRPRLTTRDTTEVTAPGEPVPTEIIVWFLQGLESRQSCSSTSKGLFTLTPLSFLGGSSTLRTIYIPLRARTKVLRPTVFPS
jgi:hypothetical protein